MFPEAMEEVTSPLQKGHVYTYSGDFWRDAGGACATQSLLFASVALLAWKCFTRLWPWLFRRSAIASQVSRRTRALRTRLRRGSNRAAADVAARLRIVSCTMAARHVLHVCVPFFPDGRLEIKIENCCRGFRWRQVAHFHEPWVLVWLRRHNLRSGFLVCHVAVQKKSFVWFSLQTKHFFCVTWKADAIHAPASQLPTVAAHSRSPWTQSRSPSSLPPHHSSAPLLSPPATVQHLLWHPYQDTSFNSNKPPLNTLSFPISLPHTTCSTLHTDVLTRLPASQHSSTALALRSCAGMVSRRVDYTICYTGKKLECWTFFSAFSIIFWACPTISNGPYFGALSSRCCSPTRIASIQKKVV